MPAVTRRGRATAAARRWPVTHPPTLALWADLAQLLTACHTRQAGIALAAKGTSCPHMADVSVLQLGIASLFLQYSGRYGWMHGKVLPLARLPFNLTLINPPLRAFACLCIVSPP